MTTANDLRARSKALLEGALKHVTAAKLTAALVPVGALVAISVQAGTISCGSGVKHCTDGGFNLHSSGIPTSDSPEWAGVNVVKNIFPLNPNTGKGGSATYVEQGGGAVAADNVLYLMYDYFQPAPNFGQNNPNSFFDVFFNVKDTDYLARIQGQTITLFEKDANTPSNTNPDGSFNTGTPWVLAADDLTEVKGVVGFGLSENDPLNAHPMAEFQVTINQAAFPNPGTNPATGLYDPNPAFWSASIGIGSGNSTLVADPAISCGVFTLQPDGSTIVNIRPCLDANGDPLAQPPAALPEPGSLSLLALGLLGLGTRFGRRRQNR